MIKTLDTFDLEQVAEEIEMLRTQGHVLHLKAGNVSFGSGQWYQFLTSLPFLKSDRRHFDVDSNLNERDWWRIEYDPNHDHTYAHSKTTQPFHTDNAWFANPPELNFFYLEKQAESGGHQLVYPIDRLLADLQKIEPELLNSLLNVEVTIQKGSELGGHRTPILKRMNEKTTKVYWNYYRIIRETQEIEDMCDAFFKFLDVQMHSKSVERLTSKTGDAFCFNDGLLLHARESFTAYQFGDRALLQSMWCFQDASQ
ncbi:MULTISPECIES: TauD/TfdA family dioxygenase [Gammaproteobacteria]|uniref:TauD/TfdA family dioxygenase n=1 Tax=Gammaproteobacteria TaxID=1236 RepID=UPI0014027A9B|nr:MULTISPECIES: TauD/TfdA family dioxygenase [Gammaproteobacteria]